VRRLKSVSSKEYGKYLTLIKPGSVENSKPVRIDKDLENAVQELARRTGSNPYLIRNAALALGLEIIEATLPDSLMLVEAIYRANSEV